MLDFGTLPKTLEELESLAAKHSEPLYWQLSVVDLLKLLKIDSGLNSRKSLARELNCPEKTMKDTLLMNMWLHKTILQLCVNPPQAENTSTENTSI